jgi:hypothetical protein
LFEKVLRVNISIGAVRIQDLDSKQMPVIEKQPTFLDKLENTEEKMMNWDNDRNDFNFKVTGAVGGVKNAGSVSAVKSAAFLHPKILN